MLVSREEAKGIVVFLYIAAHEVVFACQFLTAP